MNTPKSLSAAICFLIILIPVLCLAEPVCIPVSKVSGGEAHSLFLTESNSVWGCGHNGYWQLGDGTQINRIIPVEVNDGEMNTDSSYLENIREISAGWKHSLILDVTCCKYSSYNSLAFYKKLLIMDTMI